MCIFLLCPKQRPDKVSAKGMHGAEFNMYLAKSSMPNEFALGLKDAPCANPKCCILGTCGAPCGFTACWARKAVLEKYGRGVDDFVCFQGYLPGCCCIQPQGFFPGSPVGLVLEGCCCPVLSLSIARLRASDGLDPWPSRLPAPCLASALLPRCSVSLKHVRASSHAADIMDQKRIRPDPMDYQIIACSNILQIASCVLNIVAMLTDNRAIDEAAVLVDLIADLFTLSVAGCMAAQVDTTHICAQTLIQPSPIMSLTLTAPTLTLATAQVDHELNKTATVTGQAVPVAMAMPVQGVPVQAMERA